MVGINGETASCRLGRKSDGWKPSFHVRTWGSEAVERGDHEVHDDAGGGDVEPDGEAPADDFAMERNLIREAAIKGNQHEREDDHREEDVGAEDEEIDGPPWVCFGEERFGRDGVVGDVGEQEDGREDEGEKIQPLVGGNLSATDAEEGRAQKDRAGGVNQRVDLREHFRERGHFVRARDVAQHDDEEDHDGGDGKHKTEDDFVSHGDHSSLFCASSGDLRAADDLTRWPCAGNLSLKE